MRIKQHILAVLSAALGLTLSAVNATALAAEQNTWQTQINRQLPEIARCQLSTQVTHHNLSLNGIGSFVITVHEGADIRYQILLDQQLFLDDIRLPARAFDRVFVFDSATSAQLLNKVDSTEVLTLVEQYPDGTKELRHEFMLEGFTTAYRDFEHCLKSVQGPQLSLRQ